MQYPGKDVQQWRYMFKWRSPTVGLHKTKTQKEIFATLTTLYRKHHIGYITKIIIVILLNMFSFSCWNYLQLLFTMLECLILPTNVIVVPLMHPVLFFSRARSEGWPHHGRTFSIYICPLSFSLTLPWGVLSTFWCCPSRPCVVFLACVHLALFLALSLSPGNSFVSSWCDHSMLASLLGRRLTVPSLFQLC